MILYKIIILIMASGNKVLGKMKTKKENMVIILLNLAVLQALTSKLIFRL